MLIFRVMGGSVDRLVGEIDLAFEWRQKSRMRSAIARGARAGEAVGFDLPRGTVLRHGDLIATDTGDALRVNAAPEELIHITAGSAIALARIAYHLGLVAEAAGRLDEARQRYTEAVSGNPGWALAQSRLTALRAQTR